MKTVAIVQARMGSTRLPGKVLQDIGGRTMLARVLERVGRAHLVDGLVVATTTGPEDEAILQECHRLRIPVHRGSAEDVLDRYHDAARVFDADPVVRITSDCPLLDPGVLDETVALFRRESPDYASNVTARSYPQGLDVEVIRRSALEAAWHAATKPYERVHVTPFIYRHQDRFRIATLRADADYSGYRWTVDTADDLAFVRAVYARLGGDGPFGWRAVLDLLAREPQLLEINRHVRQKALEEG